MVLADDLHTQERFAAIAGFDPERSNLSGYFYRLGAFLMITVRSFGAPRDLYDDTCLRKPAWRDLAKTIAALEAIMRRLLLMLAAKDDSPLAPVKTRTSKCRAKPAPDPAAPRPIRYLRPAGLKARFAYAPPPARAEKHRTRTKSNRDKIYVSAFGLASRLEALIRVYADPQAFALRLRRRLARHKLKHQLCARMMAEPSGLAEDYPFFLNTLKDTEAETMAANNALVKPSG